MSGFLIGMIISILVYLGVGWYAGRKIKHLDDYYVAGRNAPTLLIVGTLVASFLSTNAFMGEVSMAYRGHGALLVIMTGVNAIGYVIGALFFGRYLRRSQALTVPEFFGKRFLSHRLQALAGITIVVGLTCYLLAVTWGVSLIITQVTGLPSATAIVVAWFGYTAFTMYSGSQGVILTDTIMFVLFASVALLALYFIVDAGGGWFSTIQQLATYEPKPDVIAWHGYLGEGSTWQTPVEALIWALILGVAWGVVVAVSPWQASRYLMARSEHVVIRSACGAAIAVYLMYLVTMFGAAAVNLSKPDIDPPESTMLWAAMNLMPTVAGAILVSGIMAAGLSSASTFLSLVGFSVSNDVFRHSDNPQKQLKSTRYTMLAVALLVLVLALVVPSNIFWITYFAGPVFASSWGVVAFMSIWSTRVTEAGAFWGMVAGFAGNVGTNLLSLLGGIEVPVYLDPILVGAAISYLAVALVSRNGSVSEEEHAYRRRLHVRPDAELDRNAVSRTLIWPKVMVVVGVVTMASVILFYALPYHRAVAAVEPDSSVFSGELAMAVGHGLIMIGISALVGWGIIRHYRS